MKHTFLFLASVILLGVVKLSDAHGMADHIENFKHPMGLEHPNLYCTQRCVTDFLGNQHCTISCL